MGKSKASNETEKVIAVLEVKHNILAELLKGHMAIEEPLLREIHEGVAVITTKLDQNEDYHRKNDEWKGRVNNAFVAVIVSLFGAVLLAACGYLREQLTPTGQPAPAPIVITATSAPTHASTLIPTLTASPTLPAPTIWLLTPAPTPDSIIEVTPRPTDFPCDFLEAYFIPDHKMNVRDATSLAGDVVGTIEAGERVRVCDEVRVETDIWLCLDVEHNTLGTPIGSDCQRAVAYQIGSLIYGRLDVVRP